MTNTSNTFLGRRLAPMLEQHPGESAIYSLEMGLDALVARLALIEVAEMSLDLQYYIWHDDTIGRVMMQQLLEAADRGVRVRLLMDDLNIGKYDTQLLVIDAHDNIEVRMFNPFGSRTFRVFDVVNFQQVNRRMHNKAFIVDNQIAIVGGRNIGDEYYTFSSEGNFGDVDLMLAGPVVREISHQFDLYWNSPLAVPISQIKKSKKPPKEELPKLRKNLSQSVQEAHKTIWERALKESKLTNDIRNLNIRLSWAPAQAVYDKPEKIERKTASLAEQKGTIVRQAKFISQQPTYELILVSPYFIPGEKGMEYFRKQRENNVEVTVLTNSLASNDVPAAFAGYRDYRRGLLELGVHLYELKPRVVQQQGRNISMFGSSGSRTGLHGKIYIMDRKYFFVGSMNLDPRSIELNTEMGVVIESAEVGDVIADQFLSSLEEIAYKLYIDKETGDLRWHSVENNKQEIFSSEPEAGFWRKMIADFTSMVIPESML